LKAISLKKAIINKSFSPITISFIPLKTNCMVTKLSHTSIFVTDQNKAYDFYVNKLGFKVNTDVMMDNGYRWLTLNPPEQPDLEIILMNVSGDGMGWDEEARKALNLLLNKGLMGAGVLYTPDCRATYEELKAKGVQFKSEPKEQFYGIEAIVTDGCGNWFSMTQPKEGL
jgi:catechol 2,3-dioxygenase-like lactoylglutathione lyase family enzyme